MALVPLHPSVNCGACGGKLPLPDAQTGIAACEYCGSQYQLADPQPATAAPPAFEPFPVGGAVAPAAQRQPRTARPRGDAAVLALAHDLLGTYTALYFQGNIPPKKEANARKAYAGLLPDEEPILALYDSTLFGAGDDGYLITGKRLCGRVFTNDPVMVTWDNLITDGARVEDCNLYFQSQQIQVEATDKTGAEALLSLMRAMAGEPVATLPGDRAAVGARATGLPARLDPATLIALARKNLCQDSSLFFSPSIPSGKEKGARGGYGALLPASEPILVLYDSTVFGAADDGFIFTADHFGFKNLGEDPVIFPWNKLPVTADQLNARASIIGFGNLKIVLGNGDMANALRATLGAILDPS
jgi:hypothetical protein